MEFEFATLDVGQKGDTGVYFATLLSSNYSNKPVLNTYVNNCSHVTQFIVS